MNNLAIAIIDGRRSMAFLTPDIPRSTTVYEYT